MPVRLRVTIPLLAVLVISVLCVAAVAPSSAVSSPPLPGALVPVKPPTPMSWEAVVGITMTIVTALATGVGFLIRWAVATATDRQATTTIQNTMTTSLACLHDKTDSNAKRADKWRHRYDRRIDGLENRLVRVETWAELQSKHPPLEPAPEAIASYDTVGEDESND